MNKVVIKYRNGGIEDYESSSIVAVNREFAFIDIGDDEITVPLEDIKVIKQLEEGGKDEME